MTQQIKQLGRLESVHGISPVYLQRALILIIVSFIFFLAMLIAFSIRQNIGYFLMATAFLIVKLFTLFGWMMQRRKEIRIYQNGFTIGKKVYQYEEIENVSLKQINQLKQEGEITKTDQEKIVLPETFHNVAGIIQKIESKIARKGVQQNEVKV